MVEHIRKSMRISHESLDDEIQRNMDACKLAAKLAGVYLTEDALSEKAYELYNKWQFDYLGKGVQFEEAYRKLKDAMALSGDYPDV